MWWLVIVAAGLIVIAIAGTKLAKKREQQIHAAKTQQNHAMRTGGITISREYEWTDTVLHEYYYRFITDDHARAVYICNGIGSHLERIPYDRINGFEVLVDSKVVGGVKRAVVGGLLAGKSGMIIGAVTAHKRKITSFKAVLYLNDVHQPTYEMPFIRTAVKSDSPDYKSAAVFAENVNAAIRAIVSDERKKANAEAGSPEDFVQKMTQLQTAMEAGLITKEEYEAKKAELLDRI